MAGDSSLSPATRRERRSRELSGSALAGSSRARLARRSQLVKDAAEAANAERAHIGDPPTSLTLGGNNHANPVPGEAPAAWPGLFHCRRRVSTGRPLRSQEPWQPASTPLEWRRAQIMSSKNRIHSDSLMMWALATIEPPTRLTTQA